MEIAPLNYGMIATSWRLCSFFLWSMLISASIVISQDDSQEQKLYREERDRNSAAHYSLSLCAFRRSDFKKSLMHRAHPGLQCDGCSYISNYWCCWWFLCGVSFSLVRVCVCMCLQCACAEVDYSLLAVITVIPDYLYIHLSSHAHCRCPSYFSFFSSSCLRGNID